jgi:hypothetical protein
MAAPPFPEGTPVLVFIAVDDNFRGSAVFTVGPHGIAVAVALPGVGAVLDSHHVSFISMVNGMIMSSFPDGRLDQVFEVAVQAAAPAGYPVMLRVQLLPQLVQQLRLLL